MKKVMGRRVLYFRKQGNLIFQNLSIVQKLVLNNSYNIYYVKSHQGVQKEKAGLLT